MVWVRSEELRHWVMLIVQPTTSLRQLDQFLRDLWLECCGHMNHFEIGDVRYSACVPGDPPMFDTDLAEPDKQHMVHTVEETSTWAKSSATSSTTAIPPVLTWNSSVLCRFPTGTCRNSPTRPMWPKVTTTTSSPSWPAPATGTLFHLRRRRPLALPREPLHRSAP